MPKLRLQQKGTELSTFLKRRMSIVLAMTALAVAVMALPSLACAATGDVDNPLVLGAPSWTTTGTTVSNVDTATYPWPYEYNIVVPLVKGKTYSFTSQTLSDTSWTFMLRADGVPARVVYSDSVGAGVEKLTFMAPDTRYYWLTLVSDNIEDFTITASPASTVSFKLSGLSVPSSKKKGKSFGVSVKLAPTYNSQGVPIKFEIQRKVGKKFKPYGTAKSTELYIPNVYTYTKYASTIKIKKKGTFRIRAVFTDAAHKAMRTGYKQIKIK
jgi:hypothetical protein